MIYKYFGSDARYSVENWMDNIPFKKKPLEDFNCFKSSAVCLCCKTSRGMDDYPRMTDSTFQYLNGAHQDMIDVRSPVCYFCCMAIYDKMAEQADGDDDQAMYRFCAMFNLYYDYDLMQRIKNDTHREYSDNGSARFVPPPVPEFTPWQILYWRTVSEKGGNVPSNQFFATDNNQLQAVIDYQKGEGAIKRLSKEAQDNRSAIIGTFHGDPFENESLEDREAMYNDLVTMMDDAMTDDLVRQKAAIEIVRTFKRIDKLSEAIRELQSSPESIVEHERQLKSLVEQKTKETSMVSQFSKDHGFAEKYAMQKSKGSGTLSAVIRDMNDSHYDPCQINKFDIETAAAIKQVSDISAESIFKQIGFSESEYAAMVKEQAGLIVDLREQRDRLKEELRMVREKQLKQELLIELEKELRDKNIPDEDIQNIINKEYRDS